MATSMTGQMEIWLKARLPAEDWQWLQSRLELAREKETLRDLHISLGLIPRKLGRADLELEQSELEALQRASNLSWDTSLWTVETAARILILCTVAEQDEAAFGPLFTDLCRTADLNESITFYQTNKLAKVCEQI